MALPLYIPPCIRDPRHGHHPPPPDKALRIQIQGPLESIQKMLPDVTWHTTGFRYSFPQPAGPKLASLTHQKLYGPGLPEAIETSIVVRDEYLAWVMEGNRPLDYIDYYGVTFDYLVPADDPDLEVLCLSIIEVDNDGGAFANEVLPFKVDPIEYTGKKVLVVPRCCQIKKGTQDRGRVNGLVAERDQKLRGPAQRT